MRACEQSGRGGILGRVGRTGAPGWSWVAFVGACAGLSVVVDARGSAGRAPAGHGSLDSLPPETRRAIFLELRHAEAPLRRRLAARRPEWPWRADHETHEVMARRWQRLAAQRRIPLHWVAQIVDEGLRAGWAPELPAVVPPLAPIPPSARVR